MRRGGFLLVAVSMMYLAPACGGGDHGASAADSFTLPGNADESGDDEAAYADALSESMSLSDFYTASEAECLASRFVEIVGVDALEAAGISPDDVRQDGVLVLPPDVPPIRAHRSIG